MVLAGQVVDELLVALCPFLRALLKALPGIIYH
jgi:hypothetical protein